MGQGIRAEIRIDQPIGCPIATISAETGASSSSISRSVDPGEPDRVTEEFDLGAEFSDAVEVSTEEELQQVFSYGSTDVYRFSREGGRGCPCERIEEFDCPIVDVRTRNGSLYLVFHAPSMEDLQAVIGNLRDRYPGLDVQRLLRSQEEHAEQNLVFVDQSKLTDRQREVLETAHSMGYFEHPKGANAGEVAEVLGITTSTFTEHLAAAQRKILSSILET